VNECISNNFSVFFFGHRLKTLNKIHTRLPELKIPGINEGYDFDNTSLLKKIQTAHPDILIVGLGQFKQEEWILSNKDKIEVPVILAVGDGIKVFAGTKIRGPEIARRIGLEWLIRLLSNPFKFWFRYTIGNSLFLMRIIKSKMTKFSNS
jgi:N-acetylglucosaminyldiphosphoundecaprenol N-acetyl-beta-D-mannosaminyltransferase